VVWHHHYFSFPLSNTLIAVQSPWLQEASHPPSFFFFPLLISFKNLSRRELAEYLQFCQAWFITTQKSYLLLLLFPPLKRESTDTIVRMANIISIDMVEVGVSLEVVLITIIITDTIDMVKYAMICQMKIGKCFDLLKLPDLTTWTKTMEI
jgi:hypothetical protein